MAAVVRGRLLHLLAVVGVHLPPAGGQCEGRAQTRCCSCPALGSGVYAAARRGKQARCSGVPAGAHTPAVGRAALTGVWGQEGTKLLSPGLITAGGYHQPWTPGFWTVTVRKQGLDATPAGTSQRPEERRDNKGRRE